MHFLRRAMLWAAARLVPRRERAEWLAEWIAELWYARQSCAVDVNRFCLGAFQDALGLRRHASECEPGAASWLASPSRCLLFLAGLDAMALLAILPVPRPSEPIPLRAILLLMGMACLILLPTTRLSLGHYPASRYAPSLATRMRRWFFLAAKIALILAGMFAGLLLAASLGEKTRAAAVLVDGLLLGSVLAFRWALRDQRRRCPVCLRLLTNPVTVGQRASWFLEWNCTELICPRGHGMLYIPENPTSWFAAPRWLYVDSSWRVRS
ncbi:MAG TPA: hypothetical protein VMR62_29215 [Bryobacteraceae bacterium]|jgi:hypothetical protein|nr:hypothetical protein [Bryobacteraceae bacterium]